MLQDLKLGPDYDGFIYLADSARNLPPIRSHRHAELELNVVVRGSISYVLEGRRFTFPRRTLLWLFPAQEHQLVDRSKDARAFIAVFKPGMLARSCRSPLYQNLLAEKPDFEGVLHTVLAEDDFAMVCQIMELLLDGGPDPETLNREAGFGMYSDFKYKHDDPDGLNAGLCHLLHRCWRMQSRGGSPQPAHPLHPAVSRALDLLTTTPERFGLPLLSKRCGASESHLSRMFAKQVGVSLTHFRNTVLLSRFQEQFRQRARVTITEAAFAAGFGSYAQFHRVYRKTFGTSPARAMKGWGMQDGRNRADAPDGRKRSTERLAT